MSQSGVIFFCLVLAFIVFVTIKGQLGTYLCILGL